MVLPSRPKLGALLAAALPILALLALCTPVAGQDADTRIQALEEQVRDLRNRVQRREFQLDEMERRLNAVEWSLQRAPIAGAAPGPPPGPPQASAPDREREWRLLCYVQYDREVRYVFGCDETRPTTREEQCGRVQSEGLRKLLSC
jgi:hypothetical protein